jgi:hypothetical protein
MTLPTGYWTTAPAGHRRQRARRDHGDHPAERRDHRGCGCDPLHRMCNLDLAPLDEVDAMEGGRLFRVR